MSYRAGAIRWKDAVDNDFVVVEPGNTLYSTGLMVATEYWDAKTETWKAIDAGDPADSEGGNA